MRKSVMIPSSPSRATWTRWFIRRLDGAEGIMGEVLVDGFYDTWGYSGHIVKLFLELLLHVPKREREREKIFKNV